MTKTRALDLPSTVLDLVRTSVLQSRVDHPDSQEQVRTQCRLRELEQSKICSKGASLVDFGTSIKPLLQHRWDSNQGTLPLKFKGF